MYFLRVLIGAWTSLVYVCRDWNCFGFRSKSLKLTVLSKCSVACFVCVFQGKGNSSVKAATGKDDEGASNSSTDYENHKSANGAEQQMNSFDELYLEEKQGSH